MKWDDSGRWIGGFIQYPDYENRDSALEDYIAMRDLKSEVPMELKDLMPGMVYTGPMPAWRVSNDYKHQGYRVGVVVSHRGNEYICTKDHAAISAFEPGATFGRWKEVWALIER